MREFRIYENKIQTQFKKWYLKDTKDWKDYYAPEITLEYGDYGIPFISISFDEYGIFGSWAGIHGCCFSDDNKLWNTLKKSWKGLGKYSQDITNPDIIQLQYSTVAHVEFIPNALRKQLTAWYLQNY